MAKPKTKIHPSESENPDEWMFASHDVALTAYLKASEAYNDWVRSYQSVPKARKVGFLAGCLEARRVLLPLSAAMYERFQVSDTSPARETWAFHEWLIRIRQRWPDELCRIRCRACGSGNNLVGTGPLVVWEAVESGMMLCKACYDRLRLLSRCTFLAYDAQNKEVTSV